MTTQTELLRAAGGYWFDGDYIHWMIFEDGNRTYNRENYINGKWVSRSRARNVDTLMAPTRMELSLHRSEE